MILKEHPFPQRIGLKARLCDQFVTRIARVEAFPELPVVAAESRDFDVFVDRQDLPEFRPDLHRHVEVPGDQFGALFGARHGAGIDAGRRQEAVSLGGEGFDLVDAPGGERVVVVGRAECVVRQVHGVALAVPEERDLHEWSNDVDMAMTRESA